MRSINDVKRKLRELKRLEAKIRNHPHRLVWDDFFKNYSLEELASMNKEDFKATIDDFLIFVYYKLYRETGEMNAFQYNPDALAAMGLPVTADISDIKKRFRELAKKYHPDNQGDAGKFIELMKNYENLLK